MEERSKTTVNAGNKILKHIDDEMQAEYALRCENGKKRSQPHTLQLDSMKNGSAKESNKREFEIDEREVEEERRLK